MAFLINVGYTTVQQAPYMLHSTAGTLHASQYSRGMAFLINVGYTTTSLVNQLIANEVLTLVAKFTIIPVAVFMEFLISMYTVKNNYSISQKCFDHLTTFLHDCYSSVCAVTDPPASDNPCIITC